MDRFKTWFTENQKKKVVPSLPMIVQEIVKESVAVKSEEQDVVNGEALDKLLYGDINPSLNLQEVLNSHKEANQAKE